MKPSSPEKKRKIKNQTKSKKKIENKSKKIQKQIQKNGRKACLTLAVTSQCRITAIACLVNDLDGTIACLVNELDGTRGVDPERPCGCSADSSYEMQA